jgi:hypothetical protein
MSCVPTAISDTERVESPFDTLHHVGGYKNTHMMVNSVGHIFMMELEVNDTTGQPTIVKIKRLKNLD